MSTQGLDVGRDIFEADARRYTWRHVLSAADFRGDSEPLLRDLTGALAVGAYADEQGFEASPADVEAAVEDFRAQHDLISAEETEQWLDHCGLTLPDLEEFFARRILVDRFSDQADEICRDYAPAEADVTAVAWAEILLSGSLEKLTVPLAWRVALRLEGTDACTPADLATVRRDAEARLERGRFDPAWFDELVEMEAILTAVERSVVTSDACAREIRVRSLQLTRVEIAEVTFPSDDQAREGYACVAGEEESLEAMADRSGQPIEITTRFYDETPEHHRGLFFSAPPGKLFLAIEADGLFAVRQLRRRIGPDVRDPEVMDMVRQRLLRTRLDALTTLHVRWLFDPWARS